MKNKKYIPIAYCPECKKKQILNITSMTHKTKGQINIGACGYCDKVLNLDDDIKIDYVTENTAKQMGWTITDTPS